MDNRFGFGGKEDRQFVVFLTISLHAILIIGLILKFMGC